MIPVEASASGRAWWADQDGAESTGVVIGGPAEGPDVIPCPALVCTAAGVVHVAYQLDEIEVAHLAQGGTLWLTTWGGLPIHLVSVQPPPTEAARP